MDLENDGRLDLLSGSYTPGDVLLFPRRPNGSFGAPVPLKDRNGKPINAGRASAVSAVDWDGDGDLDLVIGNIEGKVSLVLNQGTKEKAAFDRPVPLKAGPEGQAKELTAPGGDAGPCVADWDGDGKPDLLLGSGEGGVALYRNMGSREKPVLGKEEMLVPRSGAGGAENLSKAEFDQPKAPRSRTKPTVGDWNGDGRLDLLVGDFSYRSAGDNKSDYHGFVWVFLRQESGTPTSTH